MWYSNLLKYLTLIKKNNFSIILILILVLSRAIPHPPNFTPIIAVAIMSSYLFKNQSISILVLIISMLISDIFLGLHENIFFVYFSLILITLISKKSLSTNKFKSFLFLSFLGPIIFFLISNFGVWFLGGLGVNNIPYEKNLNGLVECYLFAIPFFKNTLISTIIFTFGAYFANTIFHRISKQYFNIN